ncbi:hypothetical protein BLNAU_14154 [Blattamonas nauphoetae]|uniref:Uncharacterized protein n=1 Tax=Blattamonas nauphoetae TaxID=2049346 RepID=A0ABQ9XER4_9EUKA|nr:hypothetical protein BLNAU_14154 [Blattamonas nauphoetae]
MKCPTKQKRNLTTQCFWTGKPKTFVHDCNACTSRSLPLSSSFLTLERLLRKQLPNSEMCAGPPIRQICQTKMLTCSSKNTTSGVHSKGWSRFCRTVPPRLVSIGVTRKAFVSWTHQISPLVLVWPPTAEFMRDWSVPPDEPDRSLHSLHTFSPHIFS